MRTFDAAWWIFGLFTEYDVIQLNHGLSAGKSISLTDQRGPGFCSRLMTTIVLYSCYVVMIVLCIITYQAESSVACSMSHCCPISLLHYYRVDPPTGLFPRLSLGRRPSTPYQKDVKCMNGYSVVKELSNDAMAMKSTFLGHH